LKGKIKIHKFVSDVLKNNPLNDPYIRDIIVYLPEDYSTSYSKGYPTIFLLPSFGNNSHSTINKNPFSLTIYQRLERLVAEKKCGSMIIAIADCFNKFGGSQYTNSRAIGNYKDHVIKEVVPFISSTYNTSKKAIMGSSSGGYGAITIGMQYPETFQAIAAHSFDSAFEYCYLPDFPAAFKTLKRGGGPKKWLKDFWNKENKPGKNDFATLNILAMAANYSPSPSSTFSSSQDSSASARSPTVVEASKRTPKHRDFDLGIEMPFDLETGELNHMIWKTWKSKDPLVLLDKYKSNLKQMNLLYFDCGINDEFNLFIGNRIFSERCRMFGIHHEYVEYEGGHSSTNFRYNFSLQKIYDSLSD
jgi:hypothetical protein